MREAEKKRTPRHRRLPMGAEPVAGGVDFRVWAPSAKAVALAVGEDLRPLPSEGDGWFGGLVPGVGAGTLYGFRLDDRGPFPDPASRFQPFGPHGPSQVVDPNFAWTDGEWPGVTLAGQVIYEMHIGTFTREGTFAAAAARLHEVRDLGIGIVNTMPVAEFPGRFGWGYDGVDLFAPYHRYGSPDDLRRLVDRAHALGLGVILDVVYNHFGPDGNYLLQFSPDYLTDRHANEWGDAVDFDGPRSGPVREFFLANVRAWIEEYHFDGLRLDATHAIVDDSPDHILAAIAREVRAAAGGRSAIVVAEDESLTIRLVRPPEQGGFGLDAVWADDFHHSASVAATGRREAYYSDHQGRPQELVSAVKFGTLFQGQRYAWLDKPRGTPTPGVPRHRFVFFLENHDQVGNSAAGRRLHQRTDPGRWRALTALLLLAPQTPMLFQGQEFAATTPFLYFADHEPPLAEDVGKGRAGLLAQFPSIAAADMAGRLHDPGDEATFAACVLDRREREGNLQALTLHRDLLALRHNDPVLATQGKFGIDGAVLAPEAFLLRWFSPQGDDRVLVVNLGADWNPASVAEPLLAPPEGRTWRPAWSSENPAYGGGGSAEPVRRDGWHFAGHAAVLMVADR